MKVGDRVTFHYPDFGTPFSYPEYRAHSGQTVTITSYAAEEAE